MAHAVHARQFDDENKVRYVVELSDHALEQIREIVRDELLAALRDQTPDRGPTPCT